MKKRPALLLAAFGGFVFLTSLVPLKGAWLDKAFSRVIGAAFGFRVEATGVRMRAWSTVSFASLQLGTNRGEVMFDSGPGRMLFHHSVFLPGEVRLGLTSVYFSKAALPTLPVLGPTSAGPYTASLRLKRVRGLPCLRIVEFEGSDMGVRGGLVFDRSNIEKASLRLTLSERWLDTLPKSVTQRLSPGEGGKRSVKLTLAGRMLTLVGMRGPLFTAEWS